MTSRLNEGIKPSGDMMTGPGGRNYSFWVRFYRKSLVWNDWPMALAVKYIILIYIIIYTDNYCDIYWWVDWWYNHDNMIY